jgi:hypothetical protein
MQCPLRCWRLVHVDYFQCVSAGSAPCDTGCLPARRSSDRLCRVLPACARTFVLSLASLDSSDVAAQATHKIQSGGGPLEISIPQVRCAHRNSVRLPPNASSYALRCWCALLVLISVCFVIVGLCFWSGPQDAWADANGVGAPGLLRFGEFVLRCALCCG